MPRAAAYEPRSDLPRAARAAAHPRSVGIPSTTSERSPSLTVRSITSPSTSGESCRHFDRAPRRPPTGNRPSGSPRHDTEAAAVSRAHPQAQRSPGRRRRSASHRGASTNVTSSSSIPGASETAVASHSRMRGMPWMPARPTRGRVDRVWLVDEDLGLAREPPVQRLLRKKRTTRARSGRSRRRFGGRER